MIDSDHSAGGKDRMAIADLVYTYALHVRNGNGADCAGLFTADAFFEMSATDPVDLSRHLRTRLEGRDAIGAYIAQAATSSSRVVPMIHNLIIAIDGADAVATCAMSAITIPSGDDLVGEYRDTFRFDGEWQFASRSHTILLYRPARAKQSLKAPAASDNS
jgi:hypothetical protein